MLPIVTMSESNVCHYSSFLFLLNSLNAWMHGHPLYASAWAGLTTSSILYHSYPRSSLRMYVYLADQLFIVCVAGCGGEIVYRKMHHLSTVYDILCAKCILWTFFIAIGLYFYGYATQRYCHDPDIELANLYHATLHLVSSVGHHLVLFW